MGDTATEWRVAGRDGLINSIVEGLNPLNGGIGGEGNACSGFLLTGSAAIGKSHLGAQALKILQSQMPVVHLYASTHMSAEPYGALAALLSDEVPAGSLTHVAALAQTQRKLKAMSGAAGVCVLIDNAHELDGHSAVLLAQLVKAGTIKLLLTCGDHDVLPHELANLVKDAVIRKLVVEPFSFDELMQAVQARLGGSISRLAGRKLWQASGGHPQFLKTLTQELCTSGALVRRGGNWCLDTSVGGSRRISAELFSNQLRRLGASQLQTLEVVALARSIAIGTLRDMVADHDVDALETMGLLRIDADHRVRVSRPLLAEVVRSRVPTGRSNAHWLKANKHSAMVRGFVAADLGMALWTLECGRPLSGATALAAARSANDALQPHSALRFLATLEASDNTTAATVEGVRAHMNLGDGPAARKLLKSYYAAPHAEPSLTEWVELVLAETSVLLTSKSTWAESQTNLDKVRAELYSQSPDPADGASAAIVLSLRRALTVATATAAWWTGNFSDVVDELAQCHESEQSGHGDDALLIGSQLYLHMAAGFNSSPGGDLAASLLESCRDHTPVRSSPAQAQAQEYLFFAHVVTGQLDTAEELARGFYQRLAADSSTHISSYADLALPLVMVFRGHGGKCLPLLEPEISQLRVRDHQGALGLALSAGAYAAVLTGDHESAAVYLAELDAYRGEAPWLIERMGSYLELAARSKLGEFHNAIAELTKLADADKMAGRLGWEVTSLGWALRLGARNVAGRLFDAAGQLESADSAFYQNFAGGILNNDAASLVQAAELAEQRGNDAAVVEVAESALALGAIEQHQHRRLSGLMESGRRHMETNARRAGDGQPLTLRQLEIAREAAAGASNKDIATKLHVSIRTVEGHLYQIFGKLRIFDRADLASALETSGGDWS